MRFVKPLTLEFLPFHIRLLCVGVLIYLVTAGCLAWSWSQAAKEQKQVRADLFGSTIVAQLAALSSESLIVNDRIRLSVLANRLAALPEVKSVNISTIDGRLLAQAGSQKKAVADSVYRKPISFEQAIAGFVEVTVAEDAFQLSIWGQILMPLLLSLTFSLMLIALVGFLPRYLANRPNKEPLQTIQEEDDDESPLFVLVVNLFNQISISPGIRQAILSSALDQARRVANVYGGRVEQLPGTGLLLIFDGAVEEDRCFHVLCAALLVQNLLNAMSHESVSHAQPRLKFRFGMHIIPCSTSDTEKSMDAKDVGSSAGDKFDRLMSSDEVTDAVLLSAVAGDDSLTVSADVFELLEDPDRIIAQQQQLPILNSLSTAAAGVCYMVTDVAESYQPLLDGQADLMLAQLSASVPGQQPPATGSTPSSATTGQSFESADS